MAVPVSNWLRFQGLSVKREFSMPWGICDFVGVSLNASRVRKRLRFGQKNSVGPMGRVALMRQIPDRETGHRITLSRLERLNPCPADVLAADLEKLITAGFVVRWGKRSFQKINGWVPLHNRILAVELKLARISDALVQASSNRAFATESFVAVPAETACRIVSGRCLSDFLKAGVGVLGVTRTKCEVVLKPSHTGIETDATLQMHCVERFWRTRDSST